MTSATSSVRQLAVRYRRSKQCEDGPLAGGNRFSLLLDRFRTHSRSHTEKKFSGNDCMQLSCRISSFRGALSLGIEGMFDILLCAKCRLLRLESSLQNKWSGSEESWLLLA